MRMKSSQSSGERLSQSRSMVLQESDLQQNPELKGDLLNVAKISDGGKKQRKNWTGMWSELTSDQLLLHKERQQEAGMKAGGKTDVVQLCGAVIEWTPDKSSRKNVFQAESYSTASKWFDGIKKTVDSSVRSHYLDSEKRPSVQLVGMKACLHVVVTLSLSRVKLPLRRSNSSEFPPRHSSLPGHGSTSTNTKQRNPVHRRSINMFVSSKLKHSTSDSADKNGVKNRLKKFIIRHRVFGCHLLTLCEREGSTVPSFVQLCLDAIEKRGMDVDGIYRVSGNLSTVQKLRFIVDQEEALDLDHSQWEDVHVVTGALKMFFRELPEPLFPFRAFQPLWRPFQTEGPGCEETDPGSARPNQDTMKLLFSHLHRYSLMNLSVFQSLMNLSVFQSLMNLSVFQSLMNLSMFQSLMNLSVFQSLMNLSVFQSDEPVCVSESDEPVCVSESDEPVCVSESDEPVCVSESDEYLSVFQSLMNTCLCVSESDEPVCVFQSLMNLSVFQSLMNLSSDEPVCVSESDEYLSVFQSLMNTCLCVSVSLMNLSVFQSDEPVCVSESDEYLSVFQSLMNLSVFQSLMNTCLCFSLMNLSVFQSLMNLSVFQSDEPVCVSESDEPVCVSESDEYLSSPGVLQAEPDVHPGIGIVFGPR
ncbi:hypothetical protein F7725_002719 [Dissostichus mawsoni]|uniref:Rho-GAP domain-containing protein n=1 Tax=Dissostichus mawsoni TaxID=36200 RepID=A0A7J5Y3C8_DISMA|nr:hypothetical protein F7725_002719 [Dissostichus mawsoni]